MAVIFAYFEYSIKLTESRRRALVIFFMIKCNLVQKFLQDEKKYHIYLVKRVFDDADKHPKLFFMSCEESCHRIERLYLTEKYDGSLQK